MSKQKTEVGIWPAKDLWGAKVKEFQPAWKIVGENTLCSASPMLSGLFNF